MLTTSVALGGGLFAAGAAAAADTPASGVSAVVQNSIFGEKVDVDGNTYDAGLFTLKTADGELKTYCIDFGFPVDIRKKIQYQESDWSTSSLGDPKRAEPASKIRWILENSYPKVSESSLAASLKIPGLTAEDAAAGTQAAIWKFSDGKNATPHSEAATKLRDYLISGANKGIAAEPKPSLSLTPDSVSGKSGSKLGPFVLNSSAAAVKLAVTGDAADKAKLVDKDGKPVGATLTGPIAKDTQLFLDVPAGTPDGSLALKADVSTEVPSGRVFLSKGYTATDHSQTMILAGSSKVSVSAGAKATWKQGKGALIDSTAKIECASGGVRVSVTNGGDEAGTVTVGKQQLTVQPGKTESVLVQVAEKTEYKITVAGPNGYSRDFQGVLDCKTGTGNPTSAPTAPATPTGTGTATPSGTPSAGGAHPAPSTTSAAPGTGGLAQTGANDSTPILAAVAGGLVVAGGAAVFVLRRRGRHGRTTA
ncbi:Cys-Gln thioester bond-forming surface protein [Streptomyces sp. CBMA123]|uniref:Cys-Gln thioester bond-forming surface protein n=1 Tax=Streptomyces sp. CBMA123 TaxID=1896313 RepID=UPI0016621A1A|nr:Cys-Gln thioester bond-forming surface protein [Streptomyces sp. CBMA123]